MKKLFGFLCFIFMTGILRAGVNFDGISQYINNGNPGSTLFGSTYTIAAWITPTTVAAGYTVCSYRGSPGIVFQMDTNAAIIRFAVRDNASVIATAQATALVANQRVHVLGERVGNNLSIWVNGVSVGSASAAFGAVSSSFFYIGAINNAGSPTGFFPGYIDEVQGWNRQLTTAEKLTLAKSNSRYIISDGLIFRYSMNQCISGSIISGVPDSSLSGLNGSSVGAPICQASAFLNYP